MECQKKYETLQIFDIDVKVLYYLRPIKISINRYFCFKHATIKVYVTNDKSRSHATKIVSQLWCDS
jgi:hypothetical protein